LQGGVGDLSPMGFATVMVDEQHVDAALKLVREYDAAEPGDDT
jgi:hypothetical protein